MKKRIDNRPRLHGTNRKIEMKYTLEDIWEQASSDKFAMRIDSSGYEAIIIFGCRITRDPLIQKRLCFSIQAEGETTTYH